MPVLETKSFKETLRVWKHAVAMPISSDGSLS